MTLYPEVFAQYGLLTRSNPGWSMTEIRDLAVRERHHWLRTALARGMKG